MSVRVEYLNLHARKYMHTYTDTMWGTFQSVIRIYVAMELKISDVVHWDMASLNPLAIPYPLGQMTDCCASILWKQDPSCQPQSLKCLAPTPH
jgi:hypothetical protein